MNITGNPSTGNYNIVEFFNSSPTNISTFNSSLCSVQRISNSQETLVVVKPDDLFPAFTQFVPNSGYIVRAKNNFVIPEDRSQPTYNSRTKNGSPNGLYTIFKNNYLSAVNISTFNTSLCSVQRASNTLETLVVVKPDDLFPAFTQFVPNSGYIVRAKNNFTINNPITATTSPLLLNSISTIAVGTLPNQNAQFAKSYAIKKDKTVIGFGCNMFDSISINDPYINDVATIAGASNGFVGLN